MAVIIEVESQTFKTKYETLKISVNGIQIGNIEVKNRYDKITDWCSFKPLDEFYIFKKFTEGKILYDIEDIVEAIQIQLNIIEPLIKGSRVTKIEKILNDNEKGAN